MSDLTAIDILVNPDEAALEHARQFNARLRESVPDGFALDATHQPHITTLQHYVRTAELEKVYDAVEQTVADRTSPRCPTGPSRSAISTGACPARDSAGS
jgi:hypothetical protein